MIKWIPVLNVKKKDDYIWANDEVFVGGEDIVDCSWVFLLFLIKALPGFQRIQKVPHLIPYLLLAIFKCLSEYIAIFTRCLKNINVLVLVIEDVTFEEAGLSNFLSTE